MRFARSMKVSIVFFFFQAEDGIRDYKVTGVQTCALPISLVRAVPHLVPARRGAPRLSDRRRRLPARAARYRPVDRSFRWWPLRPLSLLRGLAAGGRPSLLDAAGGGRSEPATPAAPGIGRSDGAAGVREMKAAERR